MKDRGSVQNFSHIWFGLSGALHWLTQLWHLSSAGPSAYVEHFHAERNHQGKGNVLLFPRSADTRRDGPVQCRERLGGLLRYYHQEAA